MCKAVLGEFNPNTAGHDEYTACVETEIRWGEKTAKYWESVAHHQTFHVALHISKWFMICLGKYRQIQIWKSRQVNLSLLRHLLTFLQHSLVLSSWLGLHRLIARHIYFGEHPELLYKKIIMIFITDNEMWIQFNPLSYLFEKYFVLHQIFP